MAHTLIQWKSKVTSQPLLRSVPPGNKWMRSDQKHTKHVRNRRKENQTRQLRRYRPSSYLVLSLSLFTSASFPPCFLVSLPLFSLSLFLCLADNDHCLCLLIVIYAAVAVPDASVSVSAWLCSIFWTIFVYISLSRSDTAQHLSWW